MSDEDFGDYHNSIHEFDANIYDDLTGADTGYGSESETNYDAHQANHTTSTHGHYDENSSHSSNPSTSQYHSQDNNSSSHTHQSQSSQPYDPSISSTNSSAHLPDPSNLIVNFLPPSYDEHQLKALFAPYGPIESVKIVVDKKTMMSLGYGFVKFMNVEAANTASAQLDGKTILNKRIKVSVSKKYAPKSNLFIAGLNRSFDEEWLRKTFSVFGIITDCKVLRDDAGRSKGVGFVRFTSSEEAQAAIDKMNEATIDGCEHPLTVKFSATDAEKNAIRAEGGNKPGRFSNNPRTNFQQQQQPFQQNDQRFGNNGGRRKTDMTSTVGMGAGMNQSVMNPMAAMMNPMAAGMGNWGTGKMSVPNAMMGNNMMGMNPMMMNPMMMNPGMMNSMMMNPSMMGMGGFTGANNMSSMPASGQNESSSASSSSASSASSSSRRRSRDRERERSSSRYRSDESDQDLDDYDRASRHKSSSSSSSRRSTSSSSSSSSSRRREDERDERRSSPRSRSSRRESSASPSRSSTSSRSSRTSGSSSSSSMPNSGMMMPTTGMMPTGNMSGMMPTGNMQGMMPNANMMPSQMWMGGAGMNPMMMPQGGMNTSSSYNKAPRSRTSASSRSGPYDRPSSPGSNSQMMPNMMMPMNPNMMSGGNMGGYY